MLLLQDARQSRWLRFTRPDEIVQAYDLSEVVPALQRLEAATRRGQYAAGFLCYEAAPAFDPALVVRPPEDRRGLPLLWFGLYSSADPVALPDAAETGFMLGEWTPSVTRAEYDAAIAAVKAHIARGNTYQVNYTMRLRAPFSGDPWALFLQLERSQQARYAAYLDIGDYVLCSASPELFFTTESGRLACKPMKGTAAARIDPGRRPLPGRLAASLRKKPRRERHDRRHGAQ